MYGKRLKKVLEPLCSDIELAVDWTSDDAEVYAEQLCKRIIRYQIAISITQIVITVLGVAAIFIYCNFNNIWDKYTVNFDFVLYAYCFVFISRRVLYIVRCCTFPELAIYNYVQSFLNEE